MELNEVAAARKDPSLVVLEGFHAVKHAVRFGGELVGVWTADAVEIEELRARFAPDVALTPEVVDQQQLAAVVPRAQLVAVARHPDQPDPDAVVADSAPAPVVLLEDPRHLGNVGAVVRANAAAGAAGVLTTGRLDPWHADALRGSAGLHFALPVRHTRVVHTGDRPLVALDPDGGDPDPSVIPARAILAFGTERDGLTDDLLARADMTVALPMEPGVSSMNLATSVAALLYVLKLRT
jgi:TrmH family RNA methyltransferase